MKSFLPCSISHRLFETRQQGILAGMRTKRGYLNFEAIANINDGSGWRHRDWLPVRQREIRGRVIKLLGAMRSEGVGGMLQEAVGSARPVKGHGQTRRPLNDPGAR